MQEQRVKVNQDEWICGCFPDDGITYAQAHTAPCPECHHGYFVSTNKPPSSLTRDDIVAMLNSANAATKGPWEAREGDWECGCCQDEDDDDPDGMSFDKRHQHECPECEEGYYDGEPPWVDGAWTIDQGDNVWPNRPTSKFIASSRTNMPLLAIQAIRMYDAIAEAGGLCSCGHIKFLHFNGGKCMCRNHDGTKCLCETVEDV